MEHIFKIIKSTWGIRISVNGDVIDRLDSTGFISIPICNTKLHIFEKCNSEVVPYVKNAIERILKRLDQVDFELIIESINYNPCDFQTEAVEPAISEWLSLLLKVQVPSYEIRFIKHLNKYSITFNDEK